MKRFQLVALAIVLLVGGNAFAQAPAASTAPAAAPVAATAPAASPAPAAVAKPTAEMKAAGAAGAVAGTLATPEAPKPSTAPAPESKVDKNMPFTRSFFFSQSDMMDIDRALHHINVSDSALGPATGEKIPQVRTISLEGIYYKSPTNWMVWLNQHKITPWITLKEIKEIVVEPTVVHLKWFDIGANAVLKLDMHPNEIYDIVTGVSLPDQTQVKQEGAKK